MPAWLFLPRGGLSHHSTWPPFLSMLLPKPGVLPALAIWQNSTSLNEFAVEPPSTLLWAMSVLLTFVLYLLSHLKYLVETCGLLLF